MNSTANQKEQNPASEHIHLEVGNTAIDITTNANVGNRENHQHNMAPEATENRQGQVTSSADGRLKENRNNNGNQQNDSSQKNQVAATNENRGNNDNKNDNETTGKKGAVLHPESDGRLKSNRQNQ